MAPMNRHSALAGYPRGGSSATRQPLPQILTSLANLGAVESIRALLWAGP
jgi:hypothetical protein